MSKKLLIFIMLTTLIYLSTIVIFNDLKNKKIANYLSAFTDEKTKQYESIYNSFRKLAISNFYVSVNKKEVTDLLVKVQNNPLEKENVRKELFRLLKADYRVLKMQGMKYFHFHLPNGESFLRFHKREVFGDKISKFRASIKQVNETQLPFEGIEEGGFHPAFRFVYPLLDKDKLVGSVELSFDISEMKNVFEKSFPTSINVIFSQSSLVKSSYIDINKEFENSKEHTGFLANKEYQDIKFNAISQLNKTQIESLENKIIKAVKTKKSFSLHKTDNELSKIVTFVAQKNELTGDIVSYIVMYSDDIYIYSLEKEFRNIIIISLVLFILLGYIIYSELRKKDVLEKLVNKKTLEIRKLYNHEVYLKSLLETVAKVNESLIASYSVGSIIDSSLSKLEEHDSYKLVTYGYVEDEKIHTRYVKGDRYGLIKDELLDLKKPYDYNGHILKSSIMAVLEDKTTFNYELDYSNFKNIHNRAGDYLLQSSISLVLKGDNNEILGVLTLYSVNDNFDHEEIALLEAVATDVSMAISVSKQRTMVEQLQQKQILNYEETILAFVDMIEHRDAYTAGHTLRVAKYCEMIAKEFKIKDEEIKRLEKAAILHDIGKIATPDTILLKPGRLSSLEYNLIKEHVNAGYDMLSKVELYKELAEIIKYHHEHYDGTGYPNNVKGDEIPFLAHILIVADAFDAMTTNRIYKSRLSPKEATQEILKCANTQFHPEVAQMAVKILSNIDIEKTTQLPQTTLEEQRFAYFFNDNLTHTYNIKYLELVLNSGEKYESLQIININNMTEYNRKKGWEEGNNFLSFFGDYLLETYKDSLIFRHQGDDFIILSKKHLSLNEMALQKLISNYPVLDITIENIETTGREYLRFKKSLFGK